MPAIHLPAFKEETALRMDLSKPKHLSFGIDFILSPFCSSDKYSACQSEIQSSDDERNGSPVTDQQSTPPNSSDDESVSPESQRGSSVSPPLFQPSLHGISRKSRKEAKNSFQQQPTFQP